MLFAEGVAGFVASQMGVQTVSVEDEQSGCAAVGSIGGGALIIVIAILIAVTGGLALPLLWLPAIGLGLAYVLRGGRTVVKKTGIDDAVRTASNSLTASSAPLPLSQQTTVVGASASVIDEITKAHALLKSGAINQEEFERLKSEALAKRG